MRTKRAALLDELSALVTRLLHALSKGRKACFESIAGRWVRGKFVTLAKSCFSRQQRARNGPPAEIE